MTQQLVITRGLPGSGKTTLARTTLHEYTRVNRDDLRTMLYGHWTGEHADEELVTSVQHHAVASALRDGRNVIVDDTNLRQRYVRRFAEMAKRHGAEFHVIDLTSMSVDTCIERDARRENPVGEQVIRDMHRKFIAGKPHPLPVPEIPDTATGEPYTPTFGRPQAVIVDVDGTVALSAHRDPYDAARAHLDTPNHVVITVVRRMENAGYRLVFCSGRDEQYRSITEQWLHRYVSDDFELYMRPHGDKRRDDTVKLELFDTHIRHFYNVAGVFDDRQRVVDAWRSIGLTVFQVAEGDF